MNDMNETASPPDAKGFTLTELLVCMCIISILVILGSSMTASTLHRARTQVCISNLKTISMATFSYLLDHDMTFPASIESYASNPMPWPDSISGYGVESPSQTRDKVWYCPETDVNTPDRVSWGCPSYGASDVIFRVRGNVDGAPEGAASGIPLTRMAQIARPSSTMMIWDNGAPGHPLWGHWQGVAMRWNDFAWPPTSDSGYWQGAPAIRHYGAKGKNDAFVAAFCDGHVEAISTGDPRVQSTTDRANMVTP